jgi:serine/threonine protein kinase
LQQRSAAAGRYRFVKPIAEGGMGRIDEAWDEDLRRRVALKTIRPGIVGEELADELLGRFLEEAQITGQLEHPSVVPVHELGIDADGRVYFAMKRVEGRNLREVIELAARGDEGWNRERLLGALQRVCEALAFAHSKGVIHRDVKPDNVMVGAFGETYVMDWGLARVLGRPDPRDLRPQTPGSSPPISTERSELVDQKSDSPMRTRANQAVGTPWYMSPEQATLRSEELDERTDVYAVGAILYHALGRRAPYAEARDPWSALQRLKEHAPAPLSGIAPEAPSELVAICEKAMARDREARYATARELADDLRAYLEGRVVRAHRTGVVIEMRKWVRRNRLASASLAAALIVAFVAGLVWLKQQELRRQAAIAESARRSFDASSRSSQRGDWSAALEHLKRARDAGFPDERALLRREAEAHLALSDLPRAEASLARLDLLPVPEVPDGEIAILRARVLLGRGAPHSDLAAMLTEARATGLSPASDAFARGILADNLREAVEHFTHTIEQDPAFQAAHDQRLSALFFLGRLDEVESAARELTMLYPQDSTAISARALSAAASGHLAEAVALLEDAGARASLADVDCLRAFVETVAILNELPLESLIGEPNPGFDLTALLGRALSRMATARDCKDPFAVAAMKPNLAHFDEDLRATISLLVSSTGLGGSLPLSVSWKPMPLEGARALVDAALDRDEDALMLHVRAADLVSSPRAPGTDEGELKERAGAMFARASQGRSWIVKIPRAALHFAIRCEYEAGAEHKRPGQLDAAFEHIRLALRTQGLTPGQTWHYADMAFTQKQPLLIFELLQRHLERHPGDRDALSRMVAAHEFLGAHERAIELADELLAKYPDDERAKKWRDRAEASLKKLAERR